MGQETQTFLDEPPFSETITSYDRKHMKLYMRLVDANRDGANWREAVRISCLASIPIKTQDAAALSTMRIWRAPGG